MGSLSEDDLFFDSNDHINPGSDSGSDGVDNSNSDSESRLFDKMAHNSGYDIWTRSPGTINDRREKLLTLMGLSQTTTLVKNQNEPNQTELLDNTKLMENSWSILRTRFRELRSLSQSSSVVSDTPELVEDDEIDPSENDVKSEGVSGLSPLGQDVVRKDSNALISDKPKSKKKWLKKLAVVAVIANGSNSTVSKDDMNVNQIVKVRTYRKRFKELSGLYMEQDIVGHKGGILTMKFSHDGEFLASAGEDEVIRVWKVVESKKPGLSRVGDEDSSNVYFGVNDCGELESVSVGKSKKARLISLRKSSESACVIFPRNVFGLEETPVHEFRGHFGEILDLSWSVSKCLLSASADKTVRLWRVGFDQCLKVFSHYSFVTSIQFNPVDENYFISGSVDGKVLIWSISRCELVDWKDIKDIVTAVCYKPDGMGAIVGSMAGNCYFYDISDNHLQMANQTSLHGKKKASSRNITGFQFSSGDQSTLTVTMADSQVRILKGVDVICKYKGRSKAGSQICASFASNKTNIISASEDSCVYIWAYSNPTDGPPGPTLHNKMSCERFFSNNVSVAIPWHSPQSNNTPTILSATSSLNHSGIMVRYNSENGLEQIRPLDPSQRSASLGLPDPFSRKIATWPQEKLTILNSLTVSSSTSKSEFGFLKTTCQNMAGSAHAWGSVIVTAGWDGRIRVFQNYGLPVRTSLVN